MSLQFCLTIAELLIIIYCVKLNSVNNFQIYRRGVRVREGLCMVDQRSGKYHGDACCLG